MNKSSEPELGGEIGFSNLEFIELSQAFICFEIKSMAEEELYVIRMLLHDFGKTDITYRRFLWIFCINDWYVRYELFHQLRSYNFKFSLRRQCVLF